MTGPGIGRRNTREASRTANIATASASDGQWMSAALRARSTKGAIRPSEVTGAPVTRLSWPVMIESEMPAKNPTRIGRERKVESTPSPSARPPR